MSATECQVRLDQAKAAYHALLTGQKVVTVRHADQEVTYRNFAGDLEKLQVYIQQLEAECGGSQRRPFGVSF